MSDPNAALAEVIRFAMFGADHAVISQQPRTGADRTRAAVTAAFECALANGLIRVAPRSEWPKYVSVTPPYEPLTPAATERTDR